MTSAILVAVVICLAAIAAIALAAWRRSAALALLASPTFTRDLVIGVTLLPIGTAGQTRCGGRGCEVHSDPIRQAFRPAEEFLKGVVS